MPASAVPASLRKVANRAMRTTWNAIFVAVVVLPVAAMVGCQNTSLQQAEEAYQKGDFDLAIRCCTEAIRLDPTSARAYDDRGLAYYRKGQYDAAIADLTAAVRFNPNYALAYSNRSLRLCLQGPLRPGDCRLHRGHPPRPERMPWPTTTLAGPTIARANPTKPSPNSPRPSA